MEQGKILKVAIVGGGPGCKAIMDMIFAEKLSQLRMQLVGVACTNPEAAGYLYAQEKGIYTTKDFRDLYRLKGLNMIIELTGREDVANEISRTSPDHVRLMDHVAARLFWDVFNIEEKRFIEQEEAQKELRGSEEKYSTLVENSLIGIYIDQDGKILFCNNRFAEMYKYSRDELRGIESWRLVHPEDRPLTDNRRSKRLKGDEVPSQYEARGLTKEGKTIWITRRNTLIEHEGRRAILGNVVDITERKQVEEELRESQERYYTVLEASPDPIVVYDVNGIGIYVNPAFTRVFGWTPGEILGMKLRYVPEENWPETKIMIDKVLAGEHFSGIESRRYTKKGKIIDVSISAATYLNTEKEPVGSLHILRNISKRKRAEEALQKAHDELEQHVEERTAELAKTTEQLKLELAERKRVEEALRLAHEELAVEADELQAANEELSQYAYVVSHDLKAPLRAIRNYSDFLREDLEGTLEEDQKMYLAGLNRSVNQGEELVGDLLEFARVGKSSGPTEPIGMGVFFEELMASLRLPPDIEVVMGNDWPTVDAEPILLMQIFQNIIGNAIKFNRASPKRVEIGWLPAGEEGCELFVRDNGIGIEPRYHQQIFGVFQRLHTREEYEGTGVGLAIVRKALSKLHGSVRVESQVGEGSTFFVVLPKTQKER
jgi:PAS domain S-box-containing protein